tara:strand:- start:222 stop:677 length:456 start_codon:yes stop_codon:yes gene_type:complete
MDNNIQAAKQPRATKTRDKETRKQDWVPPTQLPDPTPQDGFTFRWVRIAVLGQKDDRNASLRMREGWVPVKADEHPEVITEYGFKADASGNIESGGLLLCKMPTETVNSRNDYFKKKARQQEESVDNNFMRENNPRMPLFSEKRSTVSKGN